MEEKQAHREEDKRKKYYFFSPSLSLLRASITNDKYATNLFLFFLLHIQSRLIFLEKKRMIIRRGNSTRASSRILQKQYGGRFVLLSRHSRPVNTIAAWLRPVHPLSAIVVPGLRKINNPILGQRMQRRRERQHPSSLIPPSLPPPNLANVKT